MKSKAVFLIALAPVLLLLDNYSMAFAFKKFEKNEAEERVQMVQRKVLDKSSSPHVFAYIPDGNDECQFYHLDAMLAALSLKCKTVNGYSSGCHTSYGPFWREVDSASLSKWCAAMDLRLDSVIVVK